MFKKICTPILLALLLSLMLLALATPAFAANSKLVAITFDDGPSKYTNGLLDELAKRDVQVTFFVVGRNAQAYKSTILKAYEAGHQIASHTYSHPQLTKLSSAEVKSQASRTADILNSVITPATTYMLRPPYGSYNAQVLADINTPAIMWSVDTRDWESRRADAVYQHIVNDTRDGSIILMHDLYPSTIEGALRGIDYLQDQGYELVTVRELLRRRGITAAAGSTYSSAGNKGTTLPAISAPKISTSYESGQTLVTLTADPGAKIYYTIDYTGDGIAPTSQSSLYTSPLQLEGTATVRAFAALDLNGGRSHVAQAKIERPRTPAPQISLENGQANITAATGAQIYYVLNDTNPSTASAVYTQPIQLEPGSSLTAAALLPDHLLSAPITLVYSPKGNVFYDVSISSWYFADADQAVAEGLLTTQNGLFMPNALVRRGDLAQVLYRMAGSPEPQAPSDTILPATQWALEQGIITGCPDGSLQLEAPITREQLAVILQRYLTDKQPMQSEQAGTAAKLADYTDNTQIMAYARESMEWAITNGILKGNEAGLLNPAATLTRAELASIILRCR